MGGFRAEATQLLGVPEKKESPAGIDENRGR
jgi:hypothetical protein